MTTRHLLWWSGKCTSSHRSICWLQVIMLNKILNPKISTLAFDGEVDYTFRTHKSYYQDLLQSPILALFSDMFKMEVSKSIGLWRVFLEGKCFFALPRHRTNTQEKDPWKVTCIGRYQVWHLNCGQTSYNDNVDILCGFPRQWQVVDGS